LQESLVYIYVYAVEFYANTSKIRKIEQCAFCRRNKANILNL